MTAPRNVLLVEDESSIAELERRVIEDSGLRVEIAETGRSALEALRLSDRFALMVLDYRLPDMTGVDILAALGDRVSSLPVVVVTGFADPKIERSLRAAGAHEFLIKDSALEFLDRLPKVVHEALG